jgi:hypothetical protein
MNKKEEVASLIIEGEAWAKRQDARIYVNDLRAPRSLDLVLIPDLPAEFVERLKPIAKVHPAGTFPEFERAFADAGDPDMMDVLKDLYRAQRMV